MNLELEDALTGIKHKRTFSDKGCIETSISIAKKPSKVVLITGDNATGKSLVCRYINQVQNKKGFMSIEVSMGDRNKKNYMGQAYTFGRYGDEDIESTGYLTINRIIKDIDRLKLMKKPWNFTLDEPDLGMSESYARPLGEFLAKQFTELEKSDFCKGLVVVSHSRILLQSILDNLEYKPNGMLLGDSKIDFFDWLESSPQEKTISDLLSLPMRAKALRSSVQKNIKKHSS